MRSKDTTNSPLTATAAPLKPVRVLTPPRTWDGKDNADGGARVVDLGRNFAGACEFVLPASERAYAPAPAPLQMVYGELLSADGALNPLTSVAGQVKSCPGPSQCPNQPCVAVQRDTCPRQPARLNEEHSLHMHVVRK